MSAAHSVRPENAKTKGEDYHPVEQHDHFRTASPPRAVEQVNSRKETGPEKIDERGRLNFSGSEFSL